MAVDLAAVAVASVVGLVVDSVVVVFVVARAAAVAAFEADPAVTVGIVAAMAAALVGVFVQGMATGAVAGVAHASLVGVAPAGVAGTAGVVPAGTVMDGVCPVGAAAGAGAVGALAQQHSAWRRVWRSELRPADAIILRDVPLLADMLCRRDTTVPRVIMAMVAIMEASRLIPGGIEAGA